jgi:hypothetical protein
VKLESSKEDSMTVDPSAARVVSALDALTFVLDSMTPERLARQTSDGKSGGSPSGRTCASGTNPVDTIC